MLHLCNFDTATSRYCEECGGIEEIALTTLFTRVWHTHSSTDKTIKKINQCIHCYKRTNDKFTLLNEAEQMHELL